MATSRLQQTFLHPTPHPLQFTGWRRLAMGRCPLFVHGVVQLEVSATDSSGIHHVTFSRWDAVNLRTVEIAADYSAPTRPDLDVSTLNMDWNEIDTDSG